MKPYIVPKLTCVELRVEERIADNPCNGSCSEALIAAYPDKYFANVVS